MTVSVYCGDRRSVCPQRDWGPDGWAGAGWTRLGHEVGMGWGRVGCPCEGVGGVGSWCGSGCVWVPPFTGERRLGKGLYTSETVELFSPSVTGGPDGGERKSNFIIFLFSLCGYWVLVRRRQNFHWELVAVRRRSSTGSSH